MTNMWQLYSINFSTLFLIFCAVQWSAAAELELEMPWSSNGIHIFPALPIAFPSSDDAKCREDSLKIMDGLKNGTDWAERMWDASSHDPTGVFIGTSHDTGSFDECDSINGPVKTQYCLIETKVWVSPNITANNSIFRYMREHGIGTRAFPTNAVKMGKCLPASCSQSNVERYMNDYLSTLENDTAYGRYVPEFLTYNVTMNRYACTRFGERDKWNNSEIIFWSFCVLLVAISCLCGIFDSRTRDCKNRVILSFSLPRNAVDLFTVTESHNNNYLGILHGLKCIGALLVYFAHNYSFMMQYSKSLGLNEPSLPTIGYYFLRCMDLTSEIFLAISAFLLAYSIMRSNQRNRKLRPHIAIGKRISRVFPLHYFMVWFLSVAYARCGSGPLWSERGNPTQEVCTRHWWVSLLMLTGYVKSYEPLCFGEGWYATVDIHLAIVGIIVMMFLVRHETAGVILMILLTVTATIIPGAVAYYHDIKNVFDRDIGGVPILNYTAYFETYVVSYSHAGTYFLGMLTGYLFFKKPNIPEKYNSIWAILLLAFAVVFLFLPVEALRQWEVHGVDNRLFMALMVSLRRPCRALTVFCLLLAHKIYPTKLVNYLLASKFPSLMGRLLLPFYMVQYRFTIIAIFSQRHPSEAYSVGDDIMVGISRISCIIVISIFLVIFIEYPFRNLYDAFCLTSKKKTSAVMEKSALGMKVLCANNERPINGEKHNYAEHF